jgi:ubiquinone/menaquinone biosynthesis C-methylase UbiE/cytosine/adenosine deaminase-related metal-dependent hydrolase
MSTAAITSQSEDFDSWAKVYDEQPNPLLALEERFLRRMLPDIRGRNVLDAGCGTGRWLKLLSAYSPSSLIGIDSSAEMLRCAATKLESKSVLHLGSCTSLPIPDNTIDVVLSSFVLSYLPNLKAFACELNRVAAPGASVFLTDMHPDTASTCKWKRSFKANGRPKELQPGNYSLQQITNIFRECGFEVLTFIEPDFDSSEKIIFEQSGKLESYESAIGHPAIYIMQLQKLENLSPRQPHNPSKSLHLTGATYAVGPDAMTSASIELEHGSIHCILSGRHLHQQIASPSPDTIDLAGYLLLPGLINAHDHLEFSLFPRLGTGPYQNSVEWAADIHRSQTSLIARHRTVPKATRLWWGAIRNILCGVTTVCHHNPLTRELLDPCFPVRVLAKFGWAHSLAMDPNLLHNFDHTPPNLPFILHAAEGVDSKSAQEIFDLDRMQILDERTVLIHGLAFDQKAVSILNRRRAALVICPTSNQFLFHQTPSSTLIRSLDKVVLGSDSSLTSAGDLLDEISFACTKMGLTPSSLYDMVTAKSAEVLRLRNGEGHLRSGSAADLIAVRHQGLSPSDTLAQLTFDQIELVILSGRVQLASNLLFDRLPPAIKEGLHPLDIDNHRRWIRAPIDNLLIEAQKALGNELRLGGKKVNHANVA